MPRYDYRCSTCSKTYEMARSMAEADEPSMCPDGHVGATRLLPVFATTGVAGAPQPAGGSCCGGGCCS